MRRLTLAFLIACLASMLATPSAHADDWFFNPFKKKESESRVRSSFGDEPAAAETGFSMPKWELPSLPTPSWPKLPELSMPQMSLPSWSGTPGEPSTFTKLNNSTKAMFANTAKALNPWDESKKAKKGEKKNSFFSFPSLLPQKEEPKKVESVHDFIGLPKPPY